MDEPESFADLVEADEMTRHFTGMGLIGGLLRPEDALTVQRAAIERARLDAVVPEEVRDNFDRLRKLHLYGVLEYEFFSVADDLAHLVLEGALRTRFVTRYDGRIPISLDGHDGELVADSFETVYKAPRKTKLRSDDGSLRSLPRNLTDLFRWARSERLLTGQRSEALDELFVKFRNRVAHPESYSLRMPPDSARLLADVAEIINRLWGKATPEGRLFPTPIARKLRAIGLRPDHEASVEYPSMAMLRHADEEHREWTFAVFRAAPAAVERLTDFARPPETGLTFSHKPGFQTTAYPCELIWGPAPLTELVPVLDEYTRVGWEDTIDHTDRLFLVRVHCDGLELPRSPADFAALGISDDDAIWVAIRADHPWDAYQHASHEVITGRCARCSVTELGRFAGYAAAARFLAVSANA